MYVFAVPAGGEEKAMDNFIEFAMFAGAIIASIGLALGLEWLSMTGLFRLMPGQRQRIGPRDTQRRE